MKKTRKTQSQVQQKRAARRGGRSSLIFWQKRADQVLDQVLARARRVSELRKICPAKIWIVEVEVVGKRAMQRLNEQARQIASPTDVLSFELPETFRTQGLIGQLVVCLPILKSQARKMKHPEVDELRILVVHGLLHLLGFDHEKGGRAARNMERLEAKLLGISAVSRGLIRRNHTCMNRNP